LGNGFCPSISGSAEQDFYSTEAWHRIMAVNATGVFFGIKYAIPVKGFSLVEFPAGNEMDLQTGWPAQCLFFAT
jgi:NAD(P)-dependent dehydrogenase (short-subunit alcohol dehydrogenase family)